MLSANCKEKSNNKTSSLNWEGQFYSTRTVSLFMYENEAFWENKFQVLLFQGWLVTSPHNNLYHRPFINVSFLWSKLDQTPDTPVIALRNTES